MDEQYIRGINSELIKAIKALASSSGGDTSAILTKLDSIDTHIQSLMQALNTAVGVVNDKQDAANSKLDAIVTNTTPASA